MEHTLRPTKISVQHGPVGCKGDVLGLDGREEHRVVSGKVRANDLDFVTRFGQLPCHFVGEEEGSRVFGSLIVPLASLGASIGVW